MREEILGNHPRMSGVVFSDLGRASSFMALAWVQQALQSALGFAPYPATLNLRPAAKEDARVWGAIRRETKGIELSPSDGAFCSAKLFRVRITRSLPSTGTDSVAGAVLLPEVADYPQDKVEVVAPVRLKDSFNINDGDQLILEFVN